MLKCLNRKSTVSVDCCLSSILVTLEVNHQLVLTELLFSPKSAAKNPQAGGEKLRLPALTYQTPQILCQIARETVSH